MSRSRTFNLENFQQFTAINVLSDPGHIGGPVIVPNAIRVILKWSLTDGKQARNVLGGIVGGTFTPTPALAESFRAALVAGSNWSTLAGFLAPNTLLTGVDLLDIRTGTGLPVSSTGASTPGTSAAAALPDETAFVITLRTANRGASGRGRLYIPGYAANALGTVGVVLAGAVTASNGWVNNISSGFTAIGAQWAIILPARAAYAGSTGTSHPARAASAVPVTSGTARNNTWDSQRRRGLK